MRSPRFRFSVRALFLMIACIAALLGGYSFGRSRAHASAQAEVTDMAISFGRVYEPSDLLVQLPLDELASEIQQVVEPQSWAIVGGPGHIRPLGNGKLLLHTHIRAQKNVEAFLQRRTEAGAYHYR